MTPVPIPIQIRVMGPPSVIDGQGDSVPVPVGKPLALLTFLHLEGRSVPRNELAAFFWPDALPERARGSLRQTLWLLRKGLGEHLLVSDDPVGLSPGQVTTDVDTLTEALDGARDPLSVLDALWTDAPFRQFLLHDVPEWERWAEEVRERVERRVGTVLLARGDEAARGGDPERAGRLFERATVLQPHRAEAWLRRLEFLLDARRLGEADGVLAEARQRMRGDPHREEALGRIEEALRQRRQASIGAYRGRGIPTVEFVGRSREYAQLALLWRDAPEGIPTLVLLSGEAGIGKTALAQEAARLAESAGGRVVRVKAHEGDEGIPWAFLTDLVRGLLRLSGAAGTSPGSDAVLRSLVPSLQGNGNGAVGRDDIQAARVGDALHDLLTAVSEDGPLFLLLDDLHWADPESRPVLLRVLRRLDIQPVLAVLTCRAGGALRMIHRGLGGASARVVTQTLQPLSPEAVAEAVALLAEFSSPSEADRVLARLHRVSLGNPLYLLEILRYLAGQGILEWREGEPWLLLTHRLPEHLPLPATVRELLRGQFRTLPDGARRIIDELLRTPHGVHLGGAGPGGLAPGGRDAERSVEEVLARGLVTKTEGDRLVFAHDEVRAAAREEFAEVTGGDAGRRRSGGTALRWIAAGLAAVVLVTTSSVLRQMAADDAPPVAYGGGSILLFSRDEAVEVRPLGSNPAAWPVGPASRLRPGGTQVRAVGPDPEGRLVWLEARSTPSEPPWAVAVREDGEEWEVWRTDRDDFPAALSPDGRSAYVHTRDPESEEYQLNLVRVPLHGGDGTLVIRGSGRIGRTAVSPDGRRISVVRFANPDSLLVLRPDGEVVAMLPLEVDSPVRWCGSGDRILVAIPDAVSGSRLALFHPSDERVEPLPSVGFVSLPADCSPDGRAVVYQAALQGRLATVVQDLETGEWWIIDTGDLRPPTELRWIEDRTRPIPSSLVTGMDSVVVPWGGRRTLSAALALSDGSARSRPVEWTSSDPSVVSVDAGGEISANALGRAVITASWDGWLHARIPVEVTGEPGEGTLLADDFHQVDPDRWIGMGQPLPQAAVFDGEPALAIMGDGLHQDGLLLRHPLSIDQGLTAELEFRMELTRRDHQRVFLCLYDAPLPDPAVDRVDHADIPVDQGTCFVYPQGHLAAFDPQVAGLQTTPGFATQRLRLEEHLPPDGWVHVALQVRADGQVSLFLNRQRVAEGVVHLVGGPDSEWRLALFGHSVETDLLVRHLSVWVGERY